MKELLLGKAIAYDATYNAELLTPIERQRTRSEIGISEKLPFTGLDIWNAWELSWLNEKGKPLVASAQFQYSAETPFLVESKSLKLYLNSFNQTVFNSEETVRNTIQKDLSVVVAGNVEVTLYSSTANWPTLETPEGICLDTIDVSVTDYQLTPELLQGSVSESDKTTTEKLYSHLFKSNCMVTGQPDWATILIEYSGLPIDHNALLKYLISFRNHQAFHEPCVERIFVDLMNHCHPDRLSVYCRYTRRGGLDINPYRATHQAIPSNSRIWRQ